ncbi:hypothetical protein GCM10020218_095220 [Dactylosporangium vinaceum]
MRLGLIGSVSASRASVSRPFAAFSAARRVAIHSSWSAIIPVYPAKADSTSRRSPTGAAAGGDVAGLLRRGVGDVDDLGAAEVAEVQAEVQRRADDRDDVRAAEGGLARPRERQGV